MNVNEIASLGSNVKPVIQNENCAVLMLNDARQEGVTWLFQNVQVKMIYFQTCTWNSTSRFYPMYCCNTCL